MAEPGITITRIFDAPRERGLVLQPCEAVQFSRACRLAPQLIQLAVQFANAVDLRLVDVAEPELDLRTQIVAHARLELRPARGGDDGVHAERQALARDVLHDGLQVGEFGDERRQTPPDRSIRRFRSSSRRLPTDLRGSDSASRVRSCAGFRGAVPGRTRAWAIGDIR